MKLRTRRSDGGARTPRRRRRSRRRSTGMPVVCCSLHSQLAPVCAGLGERLRVAYVQLPGGALPVSLSDAVRALKARGLLETAVAVGACIDGDVALRLDVASALAWAKRDGFDVAVCAHRARDRRHRLAARPRRARGRRGGERGLGARRPADRRRSRLARRDDARAPPRRLPPHARRSAASASCVPRPRSTGLASRREVDAAGLARGLRRPAALAHGPRTATTTRRSSRPPSRRGVVARRRAR